MPTRKVITGPVLADWDETKKQAEIILQQAFGMFTLTVTDGASVHITQGSFLGEEIGMLIFVSDKEWVFRPKSEYSKK